MAQREQASCGAFGRARQLWYKGLPSLIAIDTPSGPSSQDLVVPTLHLHLHLHATHPHLTYIMRTTNPLCHSGTANLANA
jgi:hypothetical protein